MLIPLIQMLCAQVRALTPDSPSADCERLYSLAGEVLLDSATTRLETLNLELAAAPALPEPLRGSCRTSSNIEVRARFALRSDLTDAEVNALRTEKYVDFWRQVAADGTDPRMHAAALDAAAGRISILRALARNLSAGDAVRRRALVEVLFRSHPDRMSEHNVGLASLLRTTEDLQDIPADLLQGQSAYVCDEVGVHGRFAVALQVWLTDERAQPRTLEQLTQRPTWPGRGPRARPLDTQTSELTRAALRRLQDDRLDVPRNERAEKVITALTQALTWRPTTTSSDTARNLDAARRPPQTPRRDLLPPTAEASIDSALAWIHAVGRLPAQTPRDRQADGTRSLMVTALIQQLWQRPDLTVQQAAELLALRGTLALRALTTPWADTDAVALAQLLHRAELKNLHMLRPRRDEALLAEVLVLYLTGTPAHGAMPAVPAAGDAIVHAALAFVPALPPKLLLALTWNQIPLRAQPDALHVLLRRLDDPRSLLQAQPLLDQGLALREVGEKLNAAASTLDAAAPTRTP